MKMQKVFTAGMAVLMACVIAAPATLTPALAAKTQPTVTVQSILKAKKISSCKVSVASAVAYTGKALTPEVKVTDGKKVLKKDIHYKITYASNTAFGKGKITITGNKIFGYEGKKTVEFKIVPKTVAPKASVTADTVTLTWGKAAGSTKYEVFKYNANKKAYVKLATVKGTSYKDTKLKQGTQYKYKVRAVAVVKGKTYNGSYGAVAATTSVPAKKADLKSTVELFNKTINGVKSSKESFTLTVKENIALKVEDISLESMRSVINSILKNFLEPTTISYKVVKGKAASADEGNLTLNQIISPYERKVALKPEYVKSATVKKSNSSTTYTITLKSETATFDGKKSVAAKGNKSCLDILDPELLDIKPTDVSNYTITYSGTVLEFTLNSKNKITSYKTVVPLNADTMAKMGNIDLSLIISGKDTKTYTFKY